MHKKNANKIEELDKKIIRIQKSTKTLLPFMVPVNEWFRRKSIFYYKWHLESENIKLNWVFLCIYILIIFGLTLGIYKQDSYTKAISNTYVRVDGNDINCDGSSNIPYPGSGGPGLNCAVQTITKGIELVDSGGSVYVAAGTYNVTNLYITKSLTLSSSDGIGEAYIIGNQNNGIISVDGISNVTIDGFDISGPATIPGGEPFGIYINNNSNIRITNNQIHDIASGYSILALGNGGIVLGNDGVTNIEIDNNKFYNLFNTNPTIKSYGINMNSNTITDNINIHDNEFYDIYSPGNDDAGIRVSAQKADMNLIIENNTFTNVGDRAIWLRRPHTNTKQIIGNTMTGGSAGANGSGIEIKSSPDNITGNTISGYLKCIYINDNGVLAPTIQNNNLSCIQYGIEIGSNVTSSVNIRNNTIIDNQYGIIANSGSAAPLIHDNKICNVIKDISNLAAGLIDATNNYFCSSDNTEVSLMIDGLVDYRPFYINESETILCPGIFEVTTTTADGTYGTGYTINITLKYSESVNITGNPRLKLNISPLTRYAEYFSGSGTDSLIFNYIVQNGDSADLLDYDSENALELNGGIITALLDGLVGSLILPDIGTFSNAHKINISTSNPVPAPSPSPSQTSETEPIYQVEPEEIATPNVITEEEQVKPLESKECINCSVCYWNLFWYIFFLTLSLGILTIVYFYFKNNGFYINKHKTNKRNK